MFTAVQRPSTHDPGSAMPLGAASEESTNEPYDQSDPECANAEERQDSVRDEAGFSRLKIATGSRKFPEEREDSCDGSANDRAGDQANREAAVQRKRPDQA
ncbi:MAG TPA: hypothetical protein VLV78_00020 [Thermoanaerobaculia bacterium]|nr:hypothetical protein [Thermoanaerobaculia bacterium]